MDEELSVESLRGAIKARRKPGGDAAPSGVEPAARRFEAAVAQLIAELQAVLKDLPELEVVLEDEVEAFTSPAFPGESVTVHDQRLCIRCGEDFLLFDPTARAHFTTVGQVEIRASRPIPFLMEKALYLQQATAGERHVWGMRCVENLGGGLTRFDRKGILRVLQAVFA